VMRASPNSNIKEIVVNDLPRPRQRGDPRIATMYAHVEAALANEVVQASQGER